VRRGAVVVLAGLLLGAAPEPPRAVLIAHRSEPLPRNAHLFVRERWKSVMPPTTTFTLRKKGADRDVTLEHRFQPLEDGRLHELVPAADLDANAGYELTLNASSVTQTFAVQIGDARDDKAPEWDEASRQARDESPLGPIYLVWRPGPDGLVDVEALPTEVVMSLANVGTEGYIAVQPIDFAGHRLEPHELVLGGAVENPGLRRVRLVGKRAAAWSRENPTPIIVGFVSIALVVYVIAKRKRHFA